jgi:hypothetical protein
MDTYGGLTFMAMAADPNFPLPWRPTHGLVVINLSLSSGCGEFILYIKSMQMRLLIASTYFKIVILIHVCR